VNEVILLHETRSRQVLQTVIDKNIPATLSYLSQGKWYVARVLLSNLSGNSFGIRITPKKSSQSSHLQIGQTVGISFKHGYGRQYDKYVFDTTVISLAPATMIRPVDFILTAPQEIEVVLRRGYLRVQVPNLLKVNVRFWHRYCTSKDGRVTIAIGPTWDSRLVDISAGGLQIAVPAFPTPDFKKGDTIGLQFTPMPYETPVKLNAEVRNVMPAADGKDICIGLQMLGLEASPEGRLVLSRIVGIVKQYGQMN
jgi:hypothetical protein